MEFKERVRQLQRVAAEKERLKRRIEQLELLETQIQSVMANFEEVLMFAETPEPSSTRMILDEAAKVLLDQTAPMLSGTLFERLGQKGIVVGGSNPASNLSAKLSNARDRFQSHGRGKGWSLTLDQKIITVLSDSADTANTTTELMERTSESRARVNQALERLYARTSQSIYGEQATKTLPDGTTVAEWTDISYIPF